MTPDEIKTSKKAAVCGLLIATVLFLVAPAAGTEETSTRQFWTNTQFQWQERDYGSERRGRNPQQENWYGEAYEDYEESPYGYYDEDYFYGDFDFEYWDRDDDEEDWYERRFRRYENGYDRK